MWTDSYAPLSVDAVAGNEEARAEVKKWALDWSRGKAGKPLILAGPPGSGKTALARALAHEMQWQIVETSAADERDKEAIARVFGRSAGSRGLFASQRLLFVDEVDGAFDRGEIPALAQLARDSPQPLLFAANDAWAPKLAPLRAACKVVAFKSINPRSVQKVLTEIATKEGRPVELAAEIATNCGGDLRAAIIDFESGSEGGRERKVDVFRTVAKIFKAVHSTDALEAAENSDEDFDLLSRWMEENIPLEYSSPQEVAASYDWLSRADVFAGRIRRRQQWSLYRIVRFLTLAGVSSAKAHPYATFTRYKFPTMLQTLSASRAKREEIARALTLAVQKLHCDRPSAREAIALLSPIPGAGEYFGEREAGAESAGEPSKKPVRKRLR